jgi:hypothetical protein
VAGFTPQDGQNTVQLTSTTDASAPARTAGRALLARLNHPIATGLIAFIAWFAFVIARWQTWANGHITLFIMSGVKYSHPAQMSPRISHVTKAGYDGQFYYRLALNPFNWHQTAYGITMDHNYRYTRIGYPLVAWILSLGQHHLVPTVLVVINLVCVGIIGWLGGKFARESGRHALWGLLFAAYFGLVISVGRDTAEPLADACLLGGLLAYRHSRYVLAALLIAYGVLTNEPILVAAVAIALTRLYEMYRRRARPGMADLVWVLPGFAYLVLQGIEHVVVKGKTGGVADATANLTLPFKAMVPAVVRDFEKMSWTHLGMYDINLIEFIALAAFVVAGLLVLRSTTAPLHERVAFVGFVLVEMVIASGQFWDSVFGDGRTYIDAFLMAVIMLLATPSKRSPTEPSGATKLWVLTTNRVVTNKYLGWLTAVAVVALIVVARRRILFQ